MRRKSHQSCALSPSEICQAPQFVPEMQHFVLVMNDNSFLREDAVDERETGEWVKGKVNVKKGRKRYQTSMPPSWRVLDVTIYSRYIECFFGEKCKERERKEQRGVYQASLPPPGKIFGRDYFLLSSCRMLKSPGSKGEGQGKCSNGLCNLRRKLEHYQACAIAPTIYIFFL